MFMQDSAGYMKDKMRNELRWSTQLPSYTSYYVTRVPDIMPNVLPLYNRKEIAYNHAINCAKAFQERYFVMKLSPDGAIEVDGSVFVDFYLG